MERPFSCDGYRDTDYLLGCTFYVDLNAVKAGLALGIDDYKYTSAKIRLDMLRSKIQANDKQEGPPTEPVPKAEAQEEISVPMISKGEFLSVMKIDTLSNDPQLHTQGYRCSDKGFLDHTDKEYLRALEWCITNKIFEREVRRCLRTSLIALSNIDLGPRWFLSRPRRLARCIAIGQGVSRA